MNAKEIIKGDAIKDKFGDWHEVVSVYDTAVYVMDTNGSIHASNIVAHVKRYWSEKLQKYVTIPV